MKTGDPSSPRIATCPGLPRKPFRDDGLDAQVGGGTDASSPP